ncbi:MULTISPECIES: polysaccharide pyruvyl transferase family protein [unclassified Mesorhizobium]|uniref:polysaccharide pyruvyl transferase family protein n=1 Tax=unclassified Mesorhizobium TaxID=325217 RepID=UPI000FD2ED07|nr:MULTISPECIES: polysaccharide pyruvyl transferase family protein [unclassified Mesorhizobium]RUV85305.1 exopolysaccharide biosynthesis protein [Mesorhizobium sp. M5C.F.Ca.IN.020.14.1.1]RUV26856.1 exopolysaccharide biosynthesis protein [Mesorhizobium sp. M5C.F.Ca.IN.020.32.2.1]RWC46194.1 MAG: exopolysaccharide biosynthesis protein [Mesorhizobium sp.]RWF04159.1 MAG: exopolysaccharide biosynthesis protein [Mesorhizobium sp.]RWG51015.1 MAG: exopolysaccharide biosynthesis protein [Mesorhizobium s
MPVETPPVLIDRLQDMIHDCLKDYVRADEPLAILDFPDIRNCGDSAIWLGEMAYLKDRYDKRPAYVSRMRDFSAEDLERAVPTGPIFIHGGGNFGDLWITHQDFRERVLEQFPNRRIIQFPQSIHYKSQERRERSARIIGGHKNFVLLVRDEESKAFAEKHFDCEVRLCPDMAFCIGALEPEASEFPVLAMLRADLEKAGDADRSAYPDIPMEDWITESARQVRIAKAIGAASALLALKPAEVRLRKLDAAAHNRFRRGIRQISRGRAIVTDRLHVHICSLLIGRPHAVLDNSYGKIRRFMAAFSGGSDLSYKATSLDDGIGWARQAAAVAA